MPITIVLTFRDKKASDSEHSLPENKKYVNDLYYDNLISLRGLCFMHLWGFKHIT